MGYCVAHLLVGKPVSARVKPEGRPLPPRTCA